MKKTILLSTFVLMFLSFGVFADEPADSIAMSVDLAEVVVKSSNVINHLDKKVYLPTTTQRKLATNALSLVEKLHLSGVQANSLFNTISTTSGGNLILCINGREVALTDIIALKASQILRVEHDDNPGVRHKDASAVVNFVLREAQQGGSIFIDAMEAFNSTYGSNTLSTKYNYKNSEWSANYYLLHASFHRFYNINDESYDFGNNKTVNQHEEGMPGMLNYYHNSLTINYNCLKNKEWMLNVAYLGKFLNTPREVLNSTITNSDYAGKSLSLYNSQVDHSHSSALDVYLQRNISKNRLLIFDVVGTYTFTDNALQYNIYDNSNILYEIANNVKGSKYSLIGEGAYEYSFGRNKLSFGAKENVGWANNKYLGSSATETRLAQSDSYIYGEWSQKFDKWTYAAGLGGGAVWYKQGDMSYSKLSFRPMVRFSFSPTQFFAIRYKGNIDMLAPSLSELSNVCQQLDNYQIRCGNPQLTAATNYNQNITFDYHRDTWNTSINANYQYRKNPVMEMTSRKDDYFIRSFENGNSWQHLNLEYNFGLRLFYGMISCNAALGMDYYNSRGINYSHNYNNVYAVASVDLAYRCVALTFHVSTHRPSLYGETLTLGEDLHDIALTYFKKNLKVTFAMNNPFFNNYKLGSENRNVEAPFKNYRYVNETSQLCLVKVVYSMDFGRKHKTAKQRINNEDTDTGILNSGK